MAKVLIKIDKNGTKYWADYTCKRCGGAGGADAWAYTGWTCYECGGSGIASKPQVWKEYTPEYEAVLAERRAKREEKKRAERMAQAEELNKAFYEKQGFNENGKAYVVLGETYEIKDELKAKGCRWSNIMGWFCNHRIDGREMLEVDVHDCYDTDYAGVFHWTQWKTDVKDIIKRANDALICKESKSEYIAQVGDKVEVVVTLNGTHSYDTSYGYRSVTNWIYTFMDASENVIVWKTQSAIEREVDGALKPYQNGDTLKIKGTVKELSEYKGVKQTVLTRCKYAEA